MSGLQVTAGEVDRSAIAVSGGLPAEQTRARTQPRLDTMLSTLIERQVEAVLGGIAVAATHADPEGPDHDRPNWLSEDLRIAVRLTRLALAAGMVLPTVLPCTPSGLSSSPDGRLPSRHAHLVRSRSRYQAIGEAFGRLMQEGMLPPECLPAAGRLLTEITEQLARIDQTPKDGEAAGARPDEPPTAPRPPQPAEPVRHHRWGSFLPGELLG